MYLFNIILAMTHHIPVFLNNNNINIKEIFEIKSQISVFILNSQRM